MSSLQSHTCLSLSLSVRDQCWNSFVSEAVCLYIPSSGRFNALQVTEFRLGTVTTAVVLSGTAYKLKAVLN